MSSWFFRQIEPITKVTHMIRLLQQHHVPFEKPTIECYTKREETFVKVVVVGYFHQIVRTCGLPFGLLELWFIGLYGFFSWRLKGRKSTTSKRSICWIIICMPPLRWSFSLKMLLLPTTFVKWWSRFEFKCVSRQKSRQLRMMMHVDLLLSLFLAIFPWKSNLRVGFCRLKAQVATCNPHELDKYSGGNFGFL